MDKFAIFTIGFPAIVGVLYLGTAIAYAFKRDWLWATIWFSYAVADVGIMIAGNQH